MSLAEIRWVEGLYAFWDELLRRHPHWIIDYVMDLADEIGFLVYDESYAGWCVTPSPYMAERWNQTVAGMINTSIGYSPGLTACVYRLGQGTIVLNSRWCGRICQPMRRTRWRSGSCATCSTSPARKCGRNACPALASRSMTLSSPNEQLTRPHANGCHDNYPAHLELDPYRLGHLGRQSSRPNLFP